MRIAERKNFDEMVYEMNHIWTADMKSSEAMIFAVMNAWQSTAIAIKEDKASSWVGGWET